MIIIIKYATWFLAFIYFINTILMYCDVYSAIISWFAYTSFVSLIILFALSIVLGFCIWHRLPIYYIAICNIITMLSWLGVLIVKPSIIIWINFILFGFLILLAAYLKNRCNEQNGSSKT